MEQCRDLQSARKQPAPFCFRLFRKRMKFVLYISSWVDTGQIIQVHRTNRHGKSKSRMKVIWHVIWFDDRFMASIFGSLCAALPRINRSCSNTHVSRILFTARNQLLQSSQILPIRYCSTTSVITMTTDLASTPTDSGDFRLPLDVKPTHYDVTIKTDLENSIFEGVVKIEYVRVHCPSKYHWLISSALMSRTKHLPSSSTQPIWSWTMRHYIPINSR